MGQSDIVPRDIRVTPLRLAGSLALPAGPLGLVVFAHGSGSSRLSPRNRMVAERLNRDGIATLLFDLLTEEEGKDRRNVFDIALLAERLAGATDWARAEPLLRALSIGYFGASTGAAAAIAAAASRPRDIAAVVSRGGRPDLASDDALRALQAPTLLLVGALDGDVLRLNRLAQSKMTCPSQLEVVPGATHLFEEKGALERAADLASDWFQSHFRRAGAMLSGEPTPP